MADRFYGLDRGDNEFTEVVDQATSPGKDVEVAIDLAVNLTKAEVLRLIDTIKNHILDDTFPPA